MKNKAIILPIINVKDLLSTFKVRSMHQALEELSQLGIPVHGTKNKYYVYWSDFQSGNIESNDKYSGKSKHSKKLLSA